MTLKLKAGCSLWDIAGESVDVIRHGHNAYPVVTYYPPTGNVTVPIHLGEQVIATGATVADWQQKAHEWFTANRDWSPWEVV